MPYFVLSLFLYGMSNAIALLLTATWDVSSFYDIVRVCNAAMLAESDCKQAAANTGLTQCLAAICVMALLWALPARRDHYVYLTDFSASIAFAGIGAIVVSNATLNLGFELSKPFPLFREMIYSGNPATGSINNLLWPLIIQLANSSPNMRWRVAFLSLLVPIAVHSPFRGVILCIGLFAGIVPLTIYFRSQWRYSLSYTSKIIKICIAVSIIFLSLITVIAYDTASRKLNMNTDRQNADVQVNEKLAQRIMMPLFQGGLAASRAFDPGVPTISEEIAGKLRILEIKSLNAYLFNITNEGDTGEMTSLYYGEAVTRTIGPPIIWSIVAPLSFILAWLFFLKSDLDMSTIFAIALWRASLGGWVELLPSLCIQVTAMILLASLVRKTGRR